MPLKDDRLEQERQSFLQHIKDNPRDYDTRKVFADWLDEFGTDKDAEEAQRQREWNDEHSDALEYLTDFANTLEMSLDMLFTVTQDYVFTADREWPDDHTLSFDTPDECFSLSSSPDFWNAISLVWGLHTEANERRNFFRCAC